MKLKTKLIAFGAALALASPALALVHVTANITTNTTWTQGAGPYILEDNIYVTNGAILDVAPGTIIRGQPRVTTLDTAGALIVATDGFIQMRGTAAAPIIMTTALLSNGTRWVSGTPLPFLDANPATAPLAPVGVLDTNGDTVVNALDKTMQLWGGLVLCGLSYTNNSQDVDGDTLTDDGQGFIEGLSGALAVYGGVDSEHNSGTVRYVSIRHGGDGVVPAQELNALTLYACGSKTTIENIDIYCTSDDGVEVFGGTNNLKYLNITYADDDGFDVDEGYQGTAQFIFVHQGLGYGDSGMELDGDEHDVLQSVPTPIWPVSDVQVRNATVVTRGSNRGVRMRNGFAGALINSILLNREAVAAGRGVHIEENTPDSGNPDLPPFASDHFNSGLLQIRSVTAWNYSTYYDVFAVAGGVDITTAGAVTGTYEGVSIPSVYYPATNNRGSASASFNPGLAIVSDTAANGINPVPTGPVGAVGFVQTLDYVRSPAVFTGYRGAFDPAADSQWTFGWTALNIAGVLVD